MANIQVLLAQDGLRMSDVVKTTVFLTRMDDFQKMNGAYRGFFIDPLPVRTTAVVALSRPDFLVEIEAIALKPPP